MKLSKQWLLCIAIMASESALCQQNAPPEQQTSSNPAPYIALTDRLGTTEAMAAGDSERLKEIAGQDIPEADKEYAKAAYARTTFDIDGSIRHAQKCLKDARESGAKNPLSVIFCGRVLHGDYYLDDNIALWAKSGSDTRAGAAAILVPLMHTSNFLIPGIGDVQFEDYLEAPPFGGPTESRQITLPRLRTPLIPTQSPDDSQMPYGVDSVINGVQGGLLVDTGSSSSFMSNQAAKITGLNRKGGRFVHYSNAFGTVSDADTYLAFAKSFSLGQHADPSMEITNLPIVLSDAIPVNVVGLSYLSKMGSVLIQRDQIVFRPSAPPPCNEPMRIASAPMGSEWLLLSYPINGKTQQIMLDTGNTSYLEAYSGIEANPDAKMISGSRLDSLGVHAEKHQNVLVTVGDGSHQKKVSIRYYAERHPSYKFTMGLGALTDFDFFIDFKNRHACLIRKS